MSYRIHNIGAVKTVYWVALLVAAVAISFILILDPFPQGQVEAQTINEENWTSHQVLYSGARYPLSGSVPSIHGVTGPHYGISGQSYDLSVSAEDTDAGEPSNIIYEWQCIRLHGNLWIDLCPEVSNPSSVTASFTVPDVDGFDLVQFQVYVKNRVPGVAEEEYAYRAAWIIIPI